ncbi:hypothetical protein [Bradyrhizobium sp. S3.9.1]|uniref:hypothetical protein n=1 Tax=Bradyrhizobium sp. S3.9.1 TaxID=3156431 RepID=UPI00339330D9
MNAPVELAHKVVDQMKATPFVLAILIVNITVLAGFAYTLHEVSGAAARRDTILERCIK